MDKVYKHNGIVVKKEQYGESFDSWRKSYISYEAEFEENLNMCKHFVRELGNKGKYIRDGKEYIVEGTWKGIYDYSRGESGKFFTWVISNFGKDWYKLMDKYETYK